MGLLILTRDGILQVDCGKRILKVDYGLWDAVGFLNLIRGMRTMDSGKLIVDYGFVDSGI